MRIKKARYTTAVGLRYEATRDDAPEISVKGKGLIAERIVRLANRYGVPVVEKPELAKALSAIDLDQHIPEDLYEPVAIVLTSLENSS